MKVMQSFVAIVIAVMLLTWQSTAQQLETPRASPKGKVEQKVGVMDVSVSYSRPGMKGRKIFGDLVPFGEVWRTGANDPTTISFSDRVKLEGHDVPVGTYSLYTIPDQKEWTIIINKKTTGSHDEKEDAATFKVKASAMSTPVETFTINIGDVSTNTATVELAWEKTSVKFRMEFDVDAVVLDAIQKATKSPYNGVASMYNDAAGYYFDTGKDLKIALEWVNKSLELNDKPYWVWRLKSQIQAKLKDYKGAITSAETSKSRAKDAGNQQFVKFNEDAIAEWTKMR